MSISCLFTGAARVNPGHGTKIARGGGNFYYQYESVSWFLTGAMK